jgi:predicted PurR-regulated permease PerM
MLISSFLFLFYMIGLSWIGIDLSVILALFSALINIVPYVGVLTGALISTIFAIFKFHDLTHPLLAMALFGAGHLLNPKIVGRQIGLHPVFVMFSLILGGKLFGVIGLIFSVPAAVISYLLMVLFRGLSEKQILLREQFIVRNRFVTSATD